MKINGVLKSFVAVLCMFAGGSLYAERVDYRVMADDAKNALVFLKEEFRKCSYSADREEALACRTLYRKTSTYQNSFNRNLFPVLKTNDRLRIRGAFREGEHLDMDETYRANIPNIKFNKRPLNTAFVKVRKLEYILKISLPNLATYGRGLENLLNMMEKAVVSCARSERVRGRSTLVEDCHQLGDDISKFRNKTKRFIKALKADNFDEAQRLYSSHRFRSFNQAARSAITNLRRQNQLKGFYYKWRDIYKVMYKIFG